MIRILGHIVILLLMLVTPVRAAEAPSRDFQYRQGVFLREMDTGRWVVQTWGEVRWVRDFSTMSNWRISQQVQFNPSPLITFGVGYTYIQQDGYDVLSERNVERYAHRAELEANPHLRISEDVRFNCRLRLENRWIEGRGSWNPLFRARPELVFAVRNLKPLSEIYIQEELFLDLEQGRTVQNRLIPVGLTFDFKHRTRLRMFYMVESFLVHGSWAHVNVLQTQLLIDLH